MRPPYRPFASRLACTSITPKPCCRCATVCRSSRTSRRALAVPMKPFRKSFDRRDGKEGAMFESAITEMPAMEDTPFVQFWNTVLAAKFIRFRHILVGGLTHHSEAVFPTLPVHAGDRALDVGCGFGDTAIKLA